MSKKRNWHIYFATFYRNDGGWRFTVWERVDYVTSENWFLFYLSWRNGTLGDKRGISCDACAGSSTE